MSISTTAYDLGTVSMLSGSVQLKLHSSDATLAVPSETVTSISEITQRLDTLAGFTEIENVELEVVEDYSDAEYATSGFWLHAITQTDCHLEIILDGTSIFYGAIQKDACSFTDEYLSGTTHIRTGTIVFVDLMFEFKKITWAEFYAELDLHDVLNGTGRYLTLRQVLASAISEGWSQTYDEADVVMNDATNEQLDFQFRNSSSGTYVLNNALDNVWVQQNIGYFSVIGIGSSTSADQTWGTPWEFLQDMLKSFGLVAKHSYNGSVHQLLIGSRGRFPSSKFTTTDKIMESRQTVETSMKPVTINCEFNHNTQVMVGYKYLADAVPQEYNEIGSPPTASGNPHLTAAANNDREFDLSVRCPWTVYTNEMGDLYTQLYTSSGGTLYRVDAMKYYDYEADAWSDPIESLPQALATYYAQRFTDGRKMYERTYDGIQDVNVLDRHDIDDGTGSSTYYATEVRKDLMEDTTTIIWAQE